MSGNTRRNRGSPTSKLSKREWNKNPVSSPRREPSSIRRHDLREFHDEPSQSATGETDSPQASPSGRSRREAATSSNASSRGSENRALLFNVRSPFLQHAHHGGCTSVCGRAATYR